MAAPAGAREQDEVGRRNSVGKAKGKGKKSDNSPPAENDLEVKGGQDRLTHHAVGTRLCTDGAGGFSVTFACFVCLFQRIFLWDLDETIIIFHSLLTGTFAQKFGKVGSCESAKDLLY